MKKAHLLHNPTAGEGEFSKSELIKAIEKEGFKCTYSSVKEKGWEKLDDKTDFLVVAGGDGTVRRVAKALMARKRLDKHYPLALLPHGTANNIATALLVKGNVRKLVKSWCDEVLKKFDIGKINGLDEDMFFLEGFGCGIFPRLIKEMGKLKEDPDDTAEEKIKTARSVLYKTVLDYKAKACKIIADDVEHVGKYIMVEVVNTKSIGPNLDLAVSADPGDGELEIVLIPEGHQKKFETFLLNRINGQDDDFSFTILKAKKIRIEWEGKDVHVDDERIKAGKSVHVDIEILPGALEFFTGKEDDK